MAREHFHWIDISILYKVFIEKIGILHENKLYTNNQFYVLTLNMKLYPKNN